MKKAAVFVSAAALAAAAFTVPQAGAATHQGGLHFGALQFDGPGADLPRTNAKLNAEFVDLHNNSRTPVVLTGYTVKTASGFTYKFGSFKLGAYATVRLHNGQGGNTAKHVYRKKDNYWFNNSSGSVTLYASNGVKKDSCSWRANGRGYTTCH
ncbi:lamin tail domain-containing protein [Streptomyces bambusae]|uniref:lamin tail domain-containing protein n=1 Tax=Streptomyces bambusae TaxID=1550616 RepID=UPI001CFEE800|nr:lamin tail domain-containing protein [Streptomyces bambusae]MCB5165529.1 lamin tail domain-containing protein [Streptomyces bambusae]